MKSSKGQRGGRHSNRAFQGGQNIARPQVVETSYTPPPQAPSKWPSISICAIVKNEAENLEACLRPLGDLGSEIVVVDTGSTDNTVEIAESLGAKVHHFPWIDDFAAARNESIRHATGSWVFWIDADDRMSASAVAQMKAAAASGKADAYSCLVTSQRISGGADVTEHIRLFRNGLGISFSGAVHESVVQDVVRLGLRFAHTEINIQHLGYHDVGADSPKLIRNLRIIEREMKQRPNDAQLIYYRGQVRGTMGDLDGLISDMESYLSASKPSRQFDTQRFWAYYSQIRSYENRGERDSLSRVLSAAQREFPGHPGLLRVAANLRLDGDEFQEAEKLFREAMKACERVPGGYVPPQWTIDHGLAVCCDALGRKTEALSLAERAASGKPELQEAQLLVARLRLELGELDKADAALSSLMAVARGPVTLGLLAQLRSKQSRWEEARAALRESIQLGLSDSDAQQLSQAIETAQSRSQAAAPGSAGINPKKMEGMLYLKQRDGLRAAESFVAAIELEPDDPENYKCLAVALRSIGREEEALEAWRLAEQTARRGTA